MFLLKGVIAATAIRADRWERDGAAKPVPPKGWGRMAKPASLEDNGQDDEACPQQVSAGTPV